MKKIHLTFLWLAIVAAFTACKNEVDDVFDKSSAQRATEAISSCRQTLVGATNGWVMEYYGDTQYGGYNVLAKFDDNSLVTVQNEAYQSNKTFTSHFKLEQSQGVILSFDGYNDAFHYFSDPNNPDGIGDNGKGMLGDFEFRVLKVSADSILLRGKKHYSYVVMKPLKEGASWKDYLDKAKQREQDMNYTAYDLHLGDKEYRVKKSYRMLSFTDPETGDVQEMPFLQTAEGMKLYQPLTFGGKTITAFNYSADDKWLDPLDKTVMLTPYIPTLFEQITTTPWYVAYSNLGTFAKPYWDTLKNNAANVNGEEITMAVIGSIKLNNKQKGPAFGLSLMSGRYAAVYTFSYEKVSDSRITLWYNGKMELDGDYYARNGNYPVATIPFGDKDAKRTFTLSTDNMKAPTYITLTDESDPTNVIKLMKNYISMPFNN